MSQLTFKDRVAIITGAGAGLGKTYALELAKRGARIVVNDLGVAKDGSGSSHNAADIVVEEIKKAGGEAVANYDSVSTMQGGEGIVKSALDNYGTVDIVINNAGILRDKSFLKLTEEDWDSVIGVHLKGAYCTTKPAFAVMKEKGFGRVILTTSGVGLYGNFGQVNYASAKMALIGFMHGLNIEGAKYNIKTNTIAPNAASRMTESIFPPNILDKLKPEFITPLVMYLSSEENQDSGMIFNCMGGWYSRTAVMCSQGVLLGDGNREITPEEINDNWEKIKELENLKVLNNIGESFAYLGPLM